MGIWRTLHLFDYERFSRTVFNGFGNDRKEFELVCNDFLKLTPYLENGRSLLLEEKILKIDELYEKFRKIAEKHDENFKIKESDELKDESQRLLYLKGNYDYQYMRFMVFLLFLKYVDYSPFVIGGKWGISSKFEDNNSLAYQIILKLDSDLGPRGLSCDGTGITGWINTEEVSLLKLDLKNLKARKEDDISGFINLVKIADRENLGILIGTEMPNTEVYRRLPQNKLLNYRVLRIAEKQGLFFE